MKTNACLFLPENLTTLVIKVAELDNFIDPDLSNLKKDSNVLAKAEGQRLWEHAKIELVEDENVFVRFSHNHSVPVQVDIHNIFPLSEHEDIDDPLEGGSQDLIKLDAIIEDFANLFNNL